MDQVMDSLSALAIVTLFVGLILILASARKRPPSQVNARLATIERKLDAVMAHLGVTEPPPSEPDVVRFLENGQMVHAVKAYRDRTGLGLAEAKEAVDRIAREHGLDER